MQSQYDAEGEQEPAGRVAKRQAAYSDAVGDLSEWKNRLERWDTDYDIPEEPLLPVVHI